MFRHILVPTDLTDRSLVALEIAVKMAVSEEARITLLHVVEIIEDSESEELEGFYEKLERRASRRMEQMIGLYEDKTVIIGKQITFGKRVGAIIKYARDEDIDLIVLSSHKIEPEDVTQGWGTISYRVGILSHCPVMLVK
jgi:nucleotide-binding universal stress UspA family protein